MVENRRNAVGSAAIALIHSNHIHARGNALGGKPSMYCDSVEPSKP